MTHTRLFIIAALAAAAPVLAQQPIRVAATVRADTSVTTDRKSVV